MGQRELRQYDDEFRKQAVTLYFKGEKPYQQLSEELGIPVATLYGWINSGKYHSCSKQAEKISQENLAELKQLRKELADAREERDILKKALAIFSKRKP